MKERYRVTGMTCSACSARVEKVVSKLEGMEKASVNLLTETMDVRYDAGRLSPSRIVDAVVQAGYGAEVMSGRGAKGSDRPGTAGNARGSVVERAEAESHGMKRRLGISVGFLVVLMYVAMHHMLREWFGIPVPGIVLRAFDGAENAMTFALTQFLLLLPILYMNRKFFVVGFKTLAHRAPNMDSLVALGASAAVGYGLFAMYRISYGLGHGDAALVTRYSHDLYFESAGTILTLITVGKYLESRSKGKTSEAITKLMDLSPRTAVVLDEEGREREIPTDELREGDIFLVKPGSLVPADGTILEGSSGVDEAAITGESVPVEKRAGDRVVSATQNLAGFLKCRADRVGEDTTLSQIIRLVEEAGGSKAPIAKLADQVAGVFVPAVIGIALLTLAGWLVAGAQPEFAISTAIAVLVISCPCALGLATPVAIMVGTGVGAKNGILIRSGEAIQTVRDVDTVVLDKTGTVTEGKLEVTDCLGYLPGMAAETILTAACALEQKSEHPLAEAIVKEARRRNCPEIPVRDFEAVFGRGIRGVLERDVPPFSGEEGQDGPTVALGKKTCPDVGIPAGTLLYVGNSAFLEENGIPLTGDQREAAKGLADEGETALYVAVSDRLLGIIGVADVIKPTSREAVKRLQSMGIRVVMLTGDNRRTAEAVRARTGIQEVIGEVLPQEKERHVRKFQEQGHKTAMVGDGINDAPALAAADVGMAIGAGTDVAIESADIILMKSDLGDVVTAIELSRAVIRNIKQNLFWAFFYNSIGIPLAAGLLYPAFQIRLNPMFGAAAMSLSSIFVVTNALRLRGFRPSREKGKKSSDAPCEGEAFASPEEVVNTPEETGLKERSQTMTKELKIEGMMCNHCVGHVQKALEALEGAAGVVVSLEEKNAVVTMEKEISDETLKAAVVDAGYEVTDITAC